MKEEEFFFFFAPVCDIRRWTAMYIKRFCSAAHSQISREAGATVKRNISHRSCRVTNYYRAQTKRGSLFNEE